MTALHQRDLQFNVFVEGHASAPYRLHQSSAVPVTLNQRFLFPQGFTRRRDPEPCPPPFGALTVSPPFEMIFFLRPLCAHGIDLSPLNLTFSSKLLYPFPTSPPLFLTVPLISLGYCSSFPFFFCFDLLESARLLCFTPGATLTRFFPVLPPFDPTSPPLAQVSTLFVHCSTFYPPLSKISGRLETARLVVIFFYLFGLNFVPVHKLLFVVSFPLSPFFFSAVFLLTPLFSRPFLLEAPVAIESLGTSVRTQQFIFYILGCP